MKIFDAHLHCCDDSGFSSLAQAVGHENTAAHLQQEFARLGMVGGVVMSNGSLDPADLSYPPFLHYCIGLDPSVCEGMPLEEQVAWAEKNLARESCVGIKLYPGYQFFYLTDPQLEPLYRLAEKYDKPVAVHTGQTAASQGILKYAHPLLLDEAAVKYPRVRFVMCHFGNPWLADAAAVLEKNHNVAADLSGLMEGRIGDIAVMERRFRWYMEQLSGWMEYLDAYDRLMFGTDWPLVNLAEYIAFIRHIVPAAQQEAVMYGTARRIYLGES